MSQTQRPEALKPITDTKIPGTEVPNVAAAQTEDDRQKRWMSRVAVSTAVMAAAAAISTMFSSGNLNQAMFEQINQADAWSHYQSKSIKHAVLEGRLEAATQAGRTPEPKDVAKLAQYQKDQETIQAEAVGHKSLADHHMARYRILSRAATALQIGIALAAVALLLKRNSFWALALACGVVGTVFLVMGFLA